VNLKLKQLNDSQHFQDTKKDMTNKVMSLVIPVIGVINAVISAAEAGAGQQKDNRNLKNKGDPTWTVLLICTNL
jgi:hypothetical protein